MGQLPGPGAAPGLLSVFKGDAPAWVGTGRNRVAPQEGWAYCMRTDEQKHFKLYFERNAARPDLSGALPQCVYKAQWFDPRRSLDKAAGAHSPRTHKGAWRFRGVHIRRRLGFESFAELIEASNINETQSVGKSRQEATARGRP